MTIGKNQPTVDNGLIAFLCASFAATLWREWPRDMRCTVLEAGSNGFSLTGTCPHCTSFSVFMIVGSQYAELLTPDASEVSICAAMRCQSCLKYILGIAIRRQHEIEYQEHYPLGKPDDSVPKEVAATDSGIAADFAEALRCLWVKSYKAAVAMCRCSRSELRTIRRKRQKPTNQD